VGAESGDWSMMQWDVEGGVGKKARSDIGLGIRCVESGLTRIGSAVRSGISSSQLLCSLTWSHCYSC